MNVLTASNNSHQRMSIVVVGERLVGKTRLLDAYCLGPLASQRVKTTQALEIHMKKLFFSQGLLLTQFFELSGEFERAEALAIFLKLILKQKDYLGDFPIHGLLICFDLSNSHSFNEMFKWIKWLKEGLVSISKDFNPSEYAWANDIEKYVETLPLFFIANKLDLLKDKVATRMADIKPDMDSLVNFNSVVNKYVFSLSRRLKQDVQGKHYCDNLVFTSFDEGHSELDEVLESIYQSVSSSIQNKDNLSPPSPLASGLKRVSSYIYEDIDQVDDKSECPSN